MRLLRFPTQSLQIRFSWRHLFTGMVFCLLATTWKRIETELIFCEHYDVNSTIYTATNGAPYVTYARKIILLLVVSLLENIHVSKLPHSRPSVSVLFRRAPKIVQRGFTKFLNTFWRVYSSFWKQCNPVVAIWFSLLCVLCGYKFISRVTSLNLGVSRCKQDIPHQAQTSPYFIKIKLQSHLPQFHVS